MPREEDGVQLHYYTVDGRPTMVISGEGADEAYVLAERGHFRSRPSASSFDRERQATRM
jgi:hypothetical protein